MSLWERIPGWLGIVGGVAALLSFALPRYSAFGADGKTYRGIDLFGTEYIPYDVHSTPGFAPVGECVGMLSGFSGAAATLGGLALLAFAVFLALMWLDRWRNVTFAAALALFLMTGVELMVGLPYLKDVLHINYVQPGNALYPVCTIGGYESGLTLLFVGLVAVATASLWQTLATLPFAPWAQGIAAALGLFGFLVVPWDLSATPGVVDFGSAVDCVISHSNGLSQVNNPCIASGSMPLSAINLAIPVGLFFYITQAGLLTIVLALALIALRQRSVGALRLLRGVSAFTGIACVLTELLLEILVAIQFISPGAAVVGLAFLLLAIVSGRGWSAAPVPAVGRPVYNVATESDTAGRP
jgi:hypothetical protein